jgi:hypothetical protein
VVARLPSEPGVYRFRDAGVRARQAVAGLHRFRPAAGAGAAPVGPALRGAQRVTSMDADDFDAYGWAGGVLVHFGVRAGRLCRWSQQPCPQRAAAEPALAATPAAWAAFATRNAELAASLTGPAVISPAATSPTVTSTVSSAG